MNQKECQYCHKDFVKDPRVNPRQWMNQRFCSDPCRRKGCALETCQRRGFGPETSYYQFIMKYGSIRAAARAIKVHTRTLERRLWVEGGFCGSCGMYKVDIGHSADKCAHCYRKHYNINQRWRVSDEGKQYNYQYVRTEEFRKRHRETANRYSHTEKGWHTSRSGFIRRRDRKKKVGNGISTKEVRLVREIYSNKCFICGITQEEHLIKYNRSLHLDHFYPLSAGYPLTIDNVVLLCHFHNGSKNDQNPYDFFTQEQILRIKEIWKELCLKVKRN